MAIAAENSAAHLRLERHLVVLAAVVANDLEFFRGVLAARCFLRATFLAALRGRHVALVEHFLILFREQERFLALDAYGLYIGHLWLILLSALNVEL
jgi:hypothetical protein